MVLLTVTLIGNLGLALSQQQEMEAFRQYQAKQEMERMEKEMNNPLKLDIGKDRVILGNRTSPITIFEFSDFQCPYCRQGYLTVEEIRKKYGKKVTLVFRHLPLEKMHPFAMPAAKRFEAIAIQSGKKAYQYYDEVFQNQSRLGAEGEKFLDEVAQKFKVNMKKMKTDMESSKVKERIDADMAKAGELNITGTPGFVVAGVAIKGAYPAETFSQIIDKRLSQKDDKKAEKKEEKKVEQTKAAESKSEEKKEVKTE
jgi:protein-disulfide isomerase